MSISVICSHPVGVPIVHGLVEQGMLGSLALPALQTPTIAQVRAIAEQGHVPVFELTSADQFTEWLESSNPDLVLVFGLSLKVPAEALRKPPMGFLNFHPGILPQYRGPQPVFWQIRNRESHGGITVHQMDEGWDTGPIVHIEREAIGPNDTTGMLSFKLANTAMRAASAVLGPIAAGEKPAATAQDEAAAQYQKAPQPSDLIIDWANMAAEEIAALIRAANPEFIGGRTLYKGAGVWVQQATAIETDKFANEAPGKIVVASHIAGVQVTCQAGTLLKLDVLGMDIGVFSGPRFMECLGVEVGGEFTLPPQ